MEHDNCSLIAPENSKKLLDLSGFSVGGVPENVSDTCDLLLTCRHEDRYNAKNGKTFWFNMNVATGAKGIFYMTRYPISLSWLNQPGTFLLLFGKS